MNNRTAFANAANWWTQIEPDHHCVAGWVSPDPAGKAASYNECGLPMCAVAGLEPRRPTQKNEVSAIDHSTMATHNFSNDPCFCRNPTKLFTLKKCYHCFEVLNLEHTYFAHPATTTRMRTFINLLSFPNRPIDRSIPGVAVVNSCSRYLFTSRPFCLFSFCSAIYDFLSSSGVWRWPAFPLAYATAVHKEEERTHL